MLMYQLQVATTGGGKTSRKSSTSTMIHDDLFADCMSSLSLEQGVVILSPTAMVSGTGGGRSDSSRLTTPSTTMDVKVTVSDADSNMMVVEMTTGLNQLVAEDIEYRHNCNVSSFCGQLE